MTVKKAIAPAMTLLLASGVAMAAGGKKQAAGSHARSTSRPTSQPAKTHHHSPTTKPACHK